MCLHKPAARATTGNIMVGAEWVENFCDNTSQTSDLNLVFPELAVAHWPSKKIESCPEGRERLVCISCQ